MLKLERSRACRTPFHAAQRPDNQHIFLSRADRNRGAASHPLGPRHNRMLDLSSGDYAICGAVSRY
jgi:hypothetical protein